MAIAIAIPLTIANTPILAQVLSLTIVLAKTIAMAMAI